MKIKKEKESEVYWLKKKMEERKSRAEIKKNESDENDKYTKKRKKTENTTER